MAKVGSNRVKFENKISWPGSQKMQVYSHKAQQVAPKITISLLARAEKLLRSPLWANPLMSVPPLLPAVSACWSSAKSGRGICFTKNYSPATVKLNPALSRLYNLLCQGYNSQSCHEIEVGILSAHNNSNAHLVRVLTRDSIARCRRQMRVRAAPTSFVAPASVRQQLLVTIIKQ